MTLLEWKWKLFGMPDVPPCPINTAKKINRFSGKEYFPRYLTMAHLYNKGWHIESIAILHNVTRERVRQCLWKAYREGKK